MDANKSDIKDFIYTPGRFFKIPDFQRPYSWDKVNVLNFLEDLKQAVKTNQKHFFGSVVYVNEGDENSTIIDGQQRVTTVVLMLTAIYHILLDNPEKSTMHSDEILENYLFNKKDYYKEKNRIKLRTVTTDDEIYKQIFERANISSNCRESKLYRSYEIFYEHFKGQQSLEDYVKGLACFQIVKIFLDSTDDNPQKVFESINSTGKPLTDGDKIRNFALMLNNSEAREMVLNKYWKLIESELTEINKDYISDFFKYLLTAKLQRDVKIDQVYPEFKKLFYSKIDDRQDDKDKLEEFYGDILNNLDYYSFLKFNKDEDNDYKLVSDKGFRLNYLKVETHFPFLMSVLAEYKSKKIDDETLVRIFDILESFLARRIICNIYSTGLNKFFAVLHREIATYQSEYPGSNYADVFAYILANKTGDLRFPKHLEIEDNLENNEFYTQKGIYVRYILSSVDDSSKESKILRQISEGTLPLTIEHIMPQTLNNAWKKELGPTYDQIHDKYLHTLPNLTLTGYNSKYSNNSFKDKKTIENGFMDSPLVINQFIKKLDIWDLKALQKRTKWWLKQIDKVWPVPETKFAPKIQETEIIFAEDDLMGAKIKAIKIFGETYDCKNWIAAYKLILEKLFENEPEIFNCVVSDEFLPRYIKTTEDDLLEPREITGTPYYFEASLNNNYKRDVVAALLEYAEISPSEITVLLDEKA
ncbi:MAG: DUF262 domain-containing protein [bacterium]|nr:DUF262 domain-containing protein [bacterium]